MPVTKILNFILLAAVLAFLGCSDSVAPKPSAPQEASADGAGSPPKVEVGYIEMRPITIERTNQLPGRVLAFEEAEIRPQVSGIVLERLFDEGSYVEEGQQLYQIDPAIYEADLELAKANLKNANARLRNAKLRYERFKQLVKNNVVSQQQFDDAEAELNQSQAAISLAEAEVKRAQINLDYTQVRSPISGYIGPSAVTRGALLTALQAPPMATVRQLDPVYVDLSQTATEARRLQEQLLRARAAGEEDKKYRVTLYLGNSDQPYPEAGTLDATDLAVDPRTGAIRLRSVVPNPDRILLPGLFVRASIQEVGQRQAILVPQKSVTIAPDGSKSVWLVSAESTAIKRVIQTGASHKGHWIVHSGLEPGDRVIVEGRMNLREGAPLKLEALEMKVAESGGQTTGQPSEKS
ncbi:efflux RND transporter periplasmic adaptor subunit [Coraliomargarita sinensis]|uniref:Efflux RND transporter periplasmic adaptor subunit n=1 Tax=Coraliomargarita sinensis TaxID=2174842 RepID=A0A317ZHL4_9BACT|nr:efflux RND transporter periplasmic adaptor subunit [Coraliomargarita sinensis]PXA05056.1 efflux RND transporter periplasmic adaptor subunit [Coraliomargarita sinensis]